MLLHIEVSGVVAAEVWQMRLQGYPGAPLQMEVSGVVAVEVWQIAAADVSGDAAAL